MKKIIFLSIFLLVLPLSSAMAEGKGSLTLQFMAEREIEVFNEKGEIEIKRVKVSETKTIPGDEVIYTTLYNHVGKDTAENVVITNAVPEHMIYTDKSAEGKGTRITFSADGGKNYDLPSRLKVKEADGRIRSASAADYTHIHWTIDKLNPGDKGRASFKARVK
ncbi:MAG: hypothetical protein IMF07_04130 [Proteobacteria bacterium]|nr:hypothetical protein [Pseudomonadota bacterium]